MAFRRWGELNAFGFGSARTPHGFKGNKIMSKISSQLLAEGVAPFFFLPIAVVPSSRFRLACVLRACPFFVDAS